MNLPVPNMTIDRQLNAVHSQPRDALPDHLAEEHPDDHLRVSADETPAASCSLWWQRTPRYRNHRVGLIGHFAARSDASADCLLHAALTRLRREGCTLAVGPMNGSTWRDYRWVTQTGHHPPFIFEPANPPSYPLHLLRNGFRPIAHYFSALTTELRTHDPRSDRVLSRLERIGVHVRPVSTATFSDDVVAILEVARTAFRQNLFYADPDEGEFLLLCRRFQQVAASDFVVLAFERDRPIGFLLAVPDQRQLLRQQPVDTLVIKTLGVVPEHRYAGLGHVLLTRVEQAAARAGYRRAIYALVREVPHLQRISNRSARPIRRYALYARELSR